ncbi:MAG: retroviral-like aspartic protease family protein [Xanthobacteraceae bacterium]
MNVRTAADGDIVGTLSNGIVVAVLDSSEHNGKTWVHVGTAESGAPIGWVFRDYLSCGGYFSQKFQRIARKAFRYTGEDAFVASSADECQIRCGSDPACIAFTFFRSFQLCRPMNAISQLLDRSDAESGIRIRSDVALSSDESSPSNEVQPGARTAPAVTPGAILVPLKNDGGTYTVPVLINNAITLDFTVDSGASDVSIPADVVMTLIRTRTIQNTDFIGQQTFTLADGSTVPSATFRIRSLTVGNITLENIVGSVAPPQGSLLLGQSFLSRFRSWSIDNSKGVLALVQ